METKKRIAPLTVLLLVLLIVSVAGNFILYSMWNTAVVDKDQLRINVLDLEAEVNDLEYQVSDLEWEKDQLDTEITQLKAADLQLMDTTWEDNHPLFGSPYVRFYGTVVNFGVEIAYNVVLTIKIYEGAVLLKTENITLEDIYGEWYAKFDVDIEYSGDASWVDRSISWTEE